MMTTTTEALSEFLRGYGRADETALASLLDVSDWERIARQELERRATSIVQALDDATLEGHRSGHARHAGHVPTGGRRDPPGRLSPPLPCHRTPPRAGFFMTSNPQKVHLLKSSICYTALE